MPTTTAKSQQRRASLLRPLRREDVTVHELDGEALVFDWVSADTHRLNDTALYIWRQCDGLQDAHQVTRRMTEVYDVPTEVALEHVERLFGKLQEHHLVV